MDSTSRIQDEDWAFGQGDGAEYITLEQGDEAEYITLGQGEGVEYIY